MPTISPALFADGDDITAEIILVSINAILALINGNLDTDNLASGGITASDIADATITAAKLASAVLNLRRQGGSASNFATAGTTNYDEPYPLFQCGSIAGASGTMSVVFPTAFSEVPTVVAIGRGSGGVFSGGYYLVSESTTGFNLQVSATNVPPSFSWIAIGKR